MSYNTSIQLVRLMMKNPGTPCIGICSTTSLGDRVCRGCKRYAHEVIDWNRYDNQAKAAVLARIESLVTQLLDPRFRITSPERLKAELRRRKIPFNPELSAFCWLHNLLKKAPGSIGELEHCGVSLQPGYAGQDPGQLGARIEAELLRLSEAHYERYIALGACAVEHHPAGPRRNEAAV